MNGGTNPDERWCYAFSSIELEQLETEGVRVPWGSFNTECWAGGDGVDYAGEEISTLILQVSDIPLRSGVVTFEMCLIDVSTYEGEDTEDTETEDTETEDTETEDTETEDTETGDTDSAK